MRELYEKILAGEDLRENLIELKKCLKAEENRLAFREICGDTYDVFTECLADPDPKVRKNAVDILGEMEAQETLEDLMSAWRAEETHFIREDYVKALAALDSTAYLDEFHARLTALRESEVPETERKHARAEAAALQALLLDKEGLKKHKFTGYENANEVILTTLPAFREELLEALPFQKEKCPGGIAVTVIDMHRVMECRYWQEMLFAVRADSLGTTPEEIAAALAASDVLDLLLANHRGEPPFFFRVGVTGALGRQERSRLAWQAGQAIQEAFDDRLVNSPSHYEAEIRLTVDREGHITPYLKLFTIPDRRFRYRRAHVAASMRPFVAAGLIGLARPYLTDHAQVLDPFCGVGTLLVEREFAGDVRSAYGIDTFGEAIEKARGNTQIADLPIYYINRDFFDFTHDYLFDEIITDLPTGFENRAETDAFYRRFLEKAEEVLTPDGRVFCYTGEVRLLKKHLRLNGQFRLLREFPIFERSGTALLILERRGEVEKDSGAAPDDAS